MIPSFITARTPSGLRLLMLKTNTRYASQFNYFDIQQLPKLGWIAWFYMDIEQNDDFKDELLNELIKAGK